MTAAPLTGGGGFVFDNQTGLPHPAGMAKKSPKSVPDDPVPPANPPAVDPAPNAKETAGNTPPADPVEEVSASELNSSVEMPAPNERTIDALRKDEAASSAPGPATAPTPGSVGDPKPGDLDAWNRPWNPDSFFPRKAKNGTWVTRGGGKKKTAPGQPTPAPAPRSVVGDASGSGYSSGPGDRFDNAAEVYSRAAYSIADGVMNGNGEWLPDNDGEHVAFRTALAAYLRAKGSEDLPPGAAFALAAASYAGKRVTRPNTATRIRLIAAWCKAKYAEWRNRRTLAALPHREIKPEEKSPLPPIVEKPSDSST